MKEYVVAAIIGIILIVGILVGGYQLNWWLRENNTERQVNLDNQNQGTQTARQDRAEVFITNFYVIPENNVAGRNAARQNACDLIGQLNDNYVTDELYQFQLEEC
jgi:hypothetical protein